MGVLFKPTRRAAVATLVAAALFAPSAAARPIPCSGKPLVTDAAGDAYVTVGPVAESPRPAGPNTDLTGLFINNDAGHRTVNLVIADLSTDVPTDATGIRYRMTYEVGGEGRYLQAAIDSEGTVTYTYGRGATQDGDTGGALFGGKDGVISIELPASVAGGMSEIAVTTAYVRARADTPTDQMPDGEGRAAYDDAPCPTNTSRSVPSTGGSPPPSTAAGNAAATEPLRVRARPAKLKLKKVRRLRRLRLSLSASEDLEGLSAALKKGRRVVGSGKLGELVGSGRLTLKLKRKLSKGAYTLVVTGRRDDGSTGTVLLKIGVR